MPDVREIEGAPGTGYFVPASLVVLEAEPDAIDPQPDRRPFDLLARARALRRAWLDAFLGSPICVELDRNEDQRTREGVSLHLMAVVDFQARHLAAWHLAIRHAFRAGKPSPELVHPGYRGPEWRLFYQLDHLSRFGRPAVALPVSVLVHARKHGADMILAQPPVASPPTDEEPADADG